MSDAARAAAEADVSTTGMAIAATDGNALAAAIAFYDCVWH